MRHRDTCAWWVVRRQRRLHRPGVWLDASSWDAEDASADARSDSAHASANGSADAHERDGIHNDGTEEATSVNNKQPDDALSGGAVPELRRCRDSCPRRFGARVDGSDLVVPLRKVFSPFAGAVVDPSGRWQSHGLG